ncbi:MAG: isocitrate lyase/phosphoenolpyruvate mutase family protein, partial [Pseudomonadota bacterium]
AAAAAAARAAADGPFTLTARADGVMLGLYDPAEALARLQAFEAVGADVLYAPMLPDAEALRTLAAQVSKPVNALAAGPFTSLSLADFAALGVRRVSLGSSLARVAHAAVLAATETMFSDGDLSGLAAARGGGRIDAFLKD